jgi:hypothetical protein
MIALTMLRAMLAASVDTPLPAAEELIACLEKARAAIKNLSVTTEHIELPNDHLFVSEPIRLWRTTAFIVDRASRCPKRS